jgi:CDP-glycerol glycerophosphotransferase (TagB/SpsB family)
VDGVTVLPKRTPYMVLAAAALAGLPDSMWFQLGGPANWYALNGPQAVEVLSAEGLPIEKLVACGQPRVDEILKSLRDPGLAGRDRAGLGIPVGARVAVVATQPWELPGILTKEQKVSEVRAMCEQLVGIGEDVRVLVKPHPKEEADEYAAARVSSRVKVLPPSTDIIDAIRVGDVFLTQRSTSAFFAAAAGKPVLTYNLHGIPLMDHFAELGLSLPVRQAEDVQRQMHLLAVDPSTPFLTPERRRVVERHIRIDGGATAAVADLVERAIREGA